MRNTKVINFWERCYLLGWIFLNKKQFIKNEVGPYRKYLSFTSIDYPPKLLYRIRDRIIKKECLKDYLN